MFIFPFAVSWSIAQGDGLGAIAMSRSLHFPIFEPFIRHTNSSKVGWVTSRLHQGPKPQPAWFEIIPSPFPYSTQNSSLWKSVHNYISYLHYIKIFPLLHKLWLNFDYNPIELKQNQYEITHKDSKIMILDMIKKIQL